MIVIPALIKAKTVKPNVPIYSSCKKASTSSLYLAAFAYAPSHSPFTVSSQLAGADHSHCAAIPSTSQKQNNKIILFAFFER